MGFYKRGFGNKTKPKSNRVGKPDKANIKKITSLITALIDWPIHWPMTCAPLPTNLKRFFYPH